MLLTVLVSLINLLKGLKRNIFFILGLFILPLCSLAQRGCIDSFENRSWYHPHFKYLVKFTPPLLYRDSSVLYNANQIFIKKNQHENILWTKQFFNNTVQYVNSEFINSKQETILSFSLGTKAQQGLIKIDNNGNPIWSKDLFFNIQPTGLTGCLTEGNGDDIIVTSQTGTNKQILISLLDSNANQKWGKCFNLKMAEEEYLSAIRTVFHNNSLYIIAKSLITRYLPPAKQSAFLLLLKVDIVNGKIIAEKKIRLDDSMLVNTFGTSVRSYTANGVISNNFKAKYIEGSGLIIAGRKDENAFDNNRLFALNIDTNLVVSDYKLLEFNSFSFFHAGSSGYHCSISDEGHILFSLMKDTVINESGDVITGNDSYSILLNKHLEILSQKKQSLFSLGLNNINGNQKDVAPFLIEGNNYELIYHPTNSEGDSLIYLSKLSSDITNNNCMGVSVNVITKESPGNTEMSFPEYSESLFLITSQKISTQVKDESIIVDKFCSQVSRCDSIKIKADSNFCLSDSIVTLSLFKNSQCMRKVNWFVDSNFFKIVNQPNDTSIRVQLLKAYNGYIRVGFEGCTVTDSLRIHIEKPMQKLELVKDTMFCPGIPLILEAGKGYKTYLWQDGSNDETYHVTQPGSYTITVNDGCGNIFSDSTIVKPLDTDLSMNFPSSLCNYDTATFRLNSKLYNYSFEPHNNGFFVNSYLKLYPQKTTLYTIYAERFTGCILSDTLLIEVVDCPEYIHFPNAFTPNGDGLNDIFKPLFSGKFDQYRLSIYNRFGQLIFVSQNPIIGWNGKIKGELQNSGVFIWSCSYKLKNSDYKFKKGLVSLVH